MTTVNKNPTYMTEQQVSEKVSQWEWEPGVPPLYGQVCANTPTPVVLYKMYVTFW